MSNQITVRELGSHTRSVLERVQRGEKLTITRAGRPVARLLPLRWAPLSTAELKRGMAHLPEIDPGQLRDDIDELIDQELP